MRRALLRVFFLGLILLPGTGALAAGGSLNLGDLETRLQLTPEQKVQFDAALASSKQALFSLGIAAMQMQVRIASELSKANPDPDAIRREQDEVAKVVQPAFAAARTEWEKLYAMMSAEQAAMARTEVERRLAQLEIVASELTRTLREKLLEKPRS